MATKSTEEHEKIVFKAFIFPCSSVDFVAINKDLVPILIWLSLSV